MIAAMTGLGIRATAVKEAVSSRPQATMAAPSSCDICLDVGAGGEDPLAAVDDDGADVVALAPPPWAAARTSMCSCSLIAFIFGPVEADRADPVLDLQGHELRRV